MFKLQNSFHKETFENDDKLREFSKILSNQHFIAEKYLKVNEIDKFEKVKMKIVILEKERKTSQFINLDEFISPFLSIFGVGSNDSNKVQFRTALIIGKWLFEWDETELCIPRDALSSNVVLSADIDTAIHEFDSIEKLILPVRNLKNKFP